MLVEEFLHANSDTWYCAFAAFLLNLKVSVS